MSEKQKFKQSAAMKAFCKAVRPPCTEISLEDLRLELISVALELDFVETDIYMMRHKFLTTGEHAGLLNAEIESLEGWIDDTYELSVACLEFCKKWNDAHGASVMCDDKLRGQIKKAIAEK